MVQLSSGGKIAVNVVLILLALFLASLFFFVPFWKNHHALSLKDFVQKNPYLFLISFIFAIGFLVRVAFVDLLPGGLNQDEASAGYDAYAIMRYGMDRNGNHLPIHLVAWGSGQNALYSYLMIPFILILGLNELSVRLPMAFVGCLSLVLVYRYCRKYQDQKTALIALIALTICPWHIMKSRWGLESNLFPDLVLYAFLSFLSAIHSKKRWLLAISAFVMGLSSYSYGTSYFFLFFFVISLLAYACFKKLLRWYDALLYLGIVGLVCIPIILFIWINTKGGSSISFLGFTIPKLTANRFQTVTNLFSADFFSSAWTNFSSALAILAKGTDGNTYNALDWIGCLYPFSLPFTLYGLFHKADGNCRVYFQGLRFWIAVALLMCFFVSPNINRINIIYIPLMLFTGVGIADFLSLFPTHPHWAKGIVAGAYAVSFIIFFGLYAGKANGEISNEFYQGLGEAISASAPDEEKATTIYVTSEVNMPYIDVLFYRAYNVEDFLQSETIANPGGSFQYVTSFGKYKFGLPATLEKGNLYVVRTTESLYSSALEKSYPVQNFGNFALISTIGA